MPLKRRPIRQRVYADRQIGELARDVQIQLDAIPNPCTALEIINDSSADGSTIGEVLERLEAEIMRLPSAIYTGQLDVTTSSAPLLDTPQAIKAGVEVYVKPLDYTPETALIAYLGSSDVTADTGFWLYPGDRKFLAIDDISSVYVIANNTGLSISWVAS